MAKNKATTKPIKEIHHFQHHEKEKPPSWYVVKGLFTCKDLKQEEELKEEMKKKKKKKHNEEKMVEKKSKKIKCSGSLCSNTKVMHRSETAIAIAMATATSPEVVQRKRVENGVVSSANSNSSISQSSSSNGSSNNNVGSFRGMPFRRFSGCYECRMVVDPVLGFTRDPSLRSSICSCPDCGEIFMKPENLELHQAVRHAGKSPLLNLSFPSLRVRVPVISFVSRGLVCGNGMCRIIENVMKSKLNMNGSL